MWAQHVEGDIYKLDNVPLLAFGVALSPERRRALDGPGLGPPTPSA